VTVTLRADIDAVMSDWAWYIDHDGIDELMDLFTEDARYLAGNVRLSGRDEIAQRYRARTRYGARSTRHVYSGLRLTEVTPTAVRATSTWVCYAANAAAPVQSAAVYLVADFIDRLSYCADGRWRLAERRIVDVFREPSLAPLSVPA
jgi:ketosteroid isomerase-like protein